MWNFIRTFYAIAGLYQTFSLCTWQRDNFRWKTSPKSENKFIDCHENFAHCLPLMRTFLHPGDLWRVKFCWMTLCKTTQVFNKDVSTLQPKEMESGTHTKKEMSDAALVFVSHTHGKLDAVWSTHIQTDCGWDMCVCVHSKCNHMWTWLQFAKQSFRLSCVQHSQLLQYFTAKWILCSNFLPPNI